jgi:hypothetical protein
VLLETMDILAIIIALAGASFVIILSINNYGKLYRENQMLRQKLDERKQ